VTMKSWRPLRALVLSSTFVSALLMVVVSAMTPAISSPRGATGSTDPTIGPSRPHGAWRPAHGNQALARLGTRWMLRLDESGSHPPRALRSRNLVVSTLHAGRKPAIATSGRRASTLDWLPRGGRTIPREGGSRPSTTVPGGSEAGNGSSTGPIPLAWLSSIDASPGPAAPLSAPGGPFIHDATGRAVILHGVNIVYKHPPYIVYPDPGKPWNFTEADARQIAALGFDVVRLGILWQGLEPGNLGPNSPKVCGTGPSSDPGQMDYSTLQRYLDHVGETVSLLAAAHVYTILDMHQDVYNQLFGGEGEPAWAVCTDGATARPTPSDWRLAYREPAAWNAYSNFFDNSVRGDLQQQYQEVWDAVARRFAADPWVIGYDLFNEPAIGDQALECFYAGRSAGPLVTAGGYPVSCPPTEPATGLVPNLLSATPHKLLFVEPDVAARPLAYELGPLDFPNLVMSFHLYCPYRRMNGNPPPAELARCAYHDAQVFRSRATQRLDEASAAQPGGPAWFLGEFGATSSLPDIYQVTEDANRALVGWTYWSWEYYDDPTGSFDEALANPDGTPIPAKAFALSQPYAQAVAGTPTLMRFDPQSASFILSYVADPAIKAATVVFVPTALHYPHGYCATATGGFITSAYGSSYLRLANDPTSRQVTLRIRPGRCGRGTHQGT